MIVVCHQPLCRRVTATFTLSRSPDSATTQVFRRDWNAGALKRVYIPTIARAAGFTTTIYVGGAIMSITNRNVGSVFFAGLDQPNRLQADPDRSAEFADDSRLVVQAVVSSSNPDRVESTESFTTAK